MPDWYRWNSMEAFKAWHEEVKRGLGIPHPNRSLTTGRLRSTTAHWTLEYTNPVILADYDVRAIVEEEGKEFTQGLGEPCDPPPTPSDDIFAQMLKQ